MGCVRRCRGPARIPDLVPCASAGVAVSAVRFRYVAALIVALVLLFACMGCTTTPGVFPREHGSRVAEKVWLALDAVDTMQTVQIARNPRCFREADPLAARMYGTDTPKPRTVLVTNIVLALVHSSVSRWFDDGYARAEARQDDSAGPWAVGRIAWHTVSILSTGSAVAHNFSLGIGPTSARCP